MFDQISEVDWARASAFIDGEGNIHISRRGKKGSNRGHYLVITITNTDPRLVLWFKNLFGGYVVTTGKRQKVNHRQAYRWRVTCEMAAEVIRGCLPYLLLKREQAEIALAFQSTLKGSQGMGIKTPRDVFTLREEYLNKISDLKWEEHLFPESLDVIKEI